MRNDCKASLSFAVIAGTVLLCGLIFYLVFRPTLPTPLARLHLQPLALGSSVKASALLGSLPSLIHVTALGLLTCALLRPRVRSALVTGTAWASINLLWEVSCANGQAVLRHSSEWLGVARVPRCTYDGADIVASFAGAAASTFIVWLVLKFVPVPSSTA